MDSTKALLALAIIHQGEIYPKHIIKYINNDISLMPFVLECEATKFISSYIIVANNNIESHLYNLPTVGEGYNNINNLIDYLSQNNLYANNNEEPTLISADPSGYKIIKFDY